MKAPSTAIRAGVLVTGTEVLTGQRPDRNGPWLAERLRAAGVELAHLAIVGDRHDDMMDALRFMRSRGMDLVVTSGGLGPTADDLTATAVAELQEAPMVLDRDLEGRIAAIVAPLRERFPGLDAQALAAGTRKQATVPEGATVLEPVGTAPGLVVGPRQRPGPVVVVLPGPPRELQPMWRKALESEPLRALLARTRPPRVGVLRLFGIPESEIAESLRAAEATGVALDRLEITTCLHRGEIEVTTSYRADDQHGYDAFVAFLRDRHGETLFSSDGSTVDRQVAALLLDAGLTVGVAESCTGGLLAARLTDLSGSSRYVRGGIVAYADEVKRGAAGVPGELLDREGAVSAAVAQALAEGARARLGSDLGIGITGIAGPGGGSETKPVGLVWVSVAGPGDGEDPLTRSVQLPGGRSDVRERTTTVAMHMMRRRLLSRI